MEVQPKMDSVTDGGKGNTRDFFHGLLLQFTYKEGLVLG